MTKYDILKKTKEDYDGAGIYALKDQRGGAYVGQAKNVKKRINTHRRAFNSVVKGGNSYGENQKLIDAVLSGSVFEAEILCKIDWNFATVNVLRCWERYFFDRIKDGFTMYNSAHIPAPNWGSDGFNEVSLMVDIDDSAIEEVLVNTDDVQAFIKDAIRSYIG